MTAHLADLARRVVQSVRSDEGPNGGLLSSETLRAAEALDKMVRRMAFTEPVLVNQLYNVVFDDTVPEGTLAVFKVEDNGAMVEVGRLITAP